MKTVISALIALLAAAAPSLALAQDLPDSETDPMVPEEDPLVPAEDPIVGDDPLAEGATTAAPAVTTATAAGEESVALDPSRSLGVGVGFTIPGTPAIMLHKYLSPSLGIQTGLTLDLASVSVGPDGMEVDTSLFAVGAVGYLAYRLKSSKSFAINGLGGLEVGYSTVSVESGGASVDESGADIRVSVGMQAEYFVFDHLSLYAQVGLTFSVLGDLSTARRSGEVVGGGDQSAIAFDIGPRDLLHTVGMTWWL